jgi:hypothetical protein
MECYFLGSTLVTNGNHGKPTIIKNNNNNSNNTNDDDDNNNSSNNITL